jgi:hypothetical protein
MNRRALTVAMLSVLLSGCGVFQQKEMSIEIIDGCMTRIIDIDSTHAGKIMESWSVGEDCKVNAKAEDDK